MFESILFYAALVYFMSGGTIMWLFAFCIAWPVFWFCITKFVRWIIVKDLKEDESYMRDIPFPLWGYMGFLVVAYFPAYLAATFAEMIM